MQFADEKRRLMELVINHRISKDEFMEFAHKQGIAAPDDILKRWGNRYFGAPKCKRSENPRHVNRFSVGADPEFVFAHPQSGTPYIYTKNLGLNTLKAFGADMTGRQAEIRAYPSKSVLEVVASIVDCFRHMVDDNPKLYSYAWKAPGFCAPDGCGGHIHFGKQKKDAIKPTLSSLDHLTKLLVATNVVDKQGSLARQSGTNYGKPGDYRLQPHGFEYRTMPTWLDSPWSAFLTITLAKLCTFHQLNETMASNPFTDGASRQTVENLLRAYANVDDDARIALVGLYLHGMPMYSGADFKKAWGISTKKDVIKPAIAKGRRYYPPVIAPTEDTCDELFQYLTEGTPLEFYFPKPTWSPYHLAADVFPIEIPPHVPGLPEVAAGLLSKGIEVTFASSSAGIVLPDKYEFNGFNVRAQFEKLFSGKKLHFLQTHDTERITIYIPPDIAKNYVVDRGIVAKWKTFLCKSGLFPITSYEKIADIQPSEYLKVKKKSEEKLIGTMLGEFGSQEAPKPDDIVKKHKKKAIEVNGNVAF